MNLEQITMLHKVVENLSDEMLTLNIAAEIRAKLEKKRETIIEGRQGWSHPTITTNNLLLKELYNHFIKGDMIDVICLAAMIHARSCMFGESTLIQEIEE